jgi:rhodanese-related sulfurtransferase
MGIFDAFSKRPRIHHVDPKEARTLIKEGAHFIDVREPHEYKNGHATGTKNIPLRQLPRRLNRLDPDQHIVCICASGLRSARAARAAAKHGLTAYNIKGGSRAWRTAGLPWRP